MCGQLGPQHGNVATAVPLRSEIQGPGDGSIGKGPTIDPQYPYEGARGGGVLL